MQAERSALLATLSKTTMMMATRSAEGPMPESAGRPPSAVAASTTSAELTVAAMGPASSKPESEEFTTTTVATAGTKSNENEVDAVADESRRLLLGDEFHALEQRQVTCQQSLEKGRIRGHFTPEGQQQQQVSEMGRIGGQFHSQGGLTDGCYALYGGSAAVGDESEQTLDQLLVQLKVCSHSLIGRERGRGGPERMKGARGADSGPAAADAAPGGWVGE